MNINRDQVESMDPNMLLSIVNMELRDHHDRLTDYCQSINVEQSLIEQKLKTIGYEYDESQNQFKTM